MTSLRNYNKHVKSGKYSQQPILIKLKTGNKNRYKYFKIAEFIMIYVFFANNNQK